MIEVEHPKTKTCTRQKCREGIRHPQCFFVFLIILVTICLNADSNLLAPSLTIVGNEFFPNTSFHNNETLEQMAAYRDLYIGGYLSLAFFGGGAVSAMIAGYLTDTWNRKLTFVTCVVIGEIGCFCILFVTSYDQLLVTRICMGIAVGGTYPVLLSYIGDAFDVEARGKATSALTILTAGGAVIGQGLAGFTVPKLGWRFPFVLVSLITLVTIILFSIFAKEPSRGGGEKQLRDENGQKVFDEYDEILTFKKVKNMCSSASVVLLLSTGFLFSIPFGFIQTFGQVYLQDDVGPKVVGGIDTTMSTTIILSLSIAAGVGTLVGGALTDHLWKRSKPFVTIFAAITVTIGTLPLYIFANIILPLYGYFLLVIYAGLVISLGQVTKNPLLLNSTLPETRGTVFAMNTLLDDLGKGAGTFIIAVLIGAFGSRQSALNFALGMWVVSGLIFLVVSCTINRDVAKIEKQLLDFRDRKTRTIPAGEESSQSVTTPNVGGGGDKEEMDSITII